MIPLQKVKDIIIKYDNLEKELSSGSVNPKLFAKKSKEYSSFGNIISVAREYLNFEKTKMDLEQILKALGIRSRGVNIISCPSCARQAFPVIETVKILEEKLAHIKKPINISIIGCVVNGPGEAAQTDVGLTGGGQDNNLLYLSGIPHTKVPSSEIIDKIVKLIEEKTKD